MVYFSVKFFALSRDVHNKNIQIFIYIQRKTFHLEICIRRKLFLFIYFFRSALVCFLCYFCIWNANEELRSKMWFVWHFVFILVLLVFYFNNMFWVSRMWRNIKKFKICLFYSFFMCWWYIIINIDLG